MKFEVDPTFTKMFDGAGEDAKLYEEKDFAVNMHTYGIAPEKFETDKGLGKMFTMTSTSHDDEHNSTFAATIESPRYPFYATQFHPEKQVHFWQDEMGLDHSWESIMLNRYFADTFIEQVRRNKNTFGNYEETQKWIIENSDFYVTSYSTGDVYMFE